MDRPYFVFLASLCHIWLSARRTFSCRHLLVPCFWNHNDCSFPNCHQFLLHIMKLILSSICLHSIHLVQFSHQRHDLMEIAFALNWLVFRVYRLCVHWSHLGEVRRIWFKGIFDFDLRGRGFGLIHYEQGFSLLFRTWNQWDQHSISILFSFVLQHHNLHETSDTLVWFLNFQAC